MPASMAERQRADRAPGQEQDLSELLPDPPRQAQGAAGRGAETPSSITKYHRHPPLRRHQRAALRSWRADRVSVAGRIMSKRGMGKVVLLRSAGQRPAASSSTSGWTRWTRPSSPSFKKYDIGDIVGVEGEVFQHPAGRDVASRPTEVTLLSKSLLPLPEKFHGLTGQGDCATASAMWTSS